MKRIFILFIFIQLFYSVAFAKNVEIFTCNNNVEALSKLFENNWRKNPNDEYTSTVNDSSKGVLYSGTVFSAKKSLPHDKNPHLNFVLAAYNNLSQDQWMVVCYYNIHNSEIKSYEETMQMRHYMHSNYKYCRKIDELKIECGY